jgi:hypothetical protein
MFLTLALSGQRSTSSPVGGPSIVRRRRENSRSSRQLTPAEKGPTPPCLGFVRCARVRFKGHATATLGRGTTPSTVTAAVLQNPEQTGDGPSRPQHMSVQGVLQTRTDRHNTLRWKHDIALHKPIALLCRQGAFR